MKICSVETCDRKHYARGWCASHYSRWWSGGDVRADVPIGTSHIHVTAHGTKNEYGNYGCRCARCRKANSIYQRTIRKFP